MTARDAPAGASARVSEDEKMSENTEELLIRELNTALRGYHPVIEGDTDDAGGRVLTVTVPNPGPAHYGIEAVVTFRKGSPSCRVRFGATTVCDGIAPARLPEVFSEITGGGIVSVMRFKNRDDYDMRHPRGEGQIIRIPRGSFSDDADALDRGHPLRPVLVSLDRKPSFTERLFGTNIGVFEIACFAGTVVIERTARGSVRLTDA